MNLLPEHNFAIEWWPIDQPLDYPKNARKWTAQAVDKVAASIREYGWKQPLVCDSGDVIIIGHLRRAAGRKAGMTECPVHVARDLTPEQTAAVDALTNGIVNKLMHGPTVALRDAARRPGGLGRSGSRILRVVRRSRSSGGRSA